MIFACFGKTPRKKYHPKLGRKKPTEKNLQGIKPGPKLGRKNTQGKKPPRKKPRK